MSNNQNSTAGGCCSWFCFCFGASSTNEDPKKEPLLEEQKDILQNPSKTKIDPLVPHNPQTIQEVKSSEAQQRNENIIENRMEHEKTEESSAETSNGELVIALGNNSTSDNPQKKNSISLQTGDGTVIISIEKPLQPVSLRDLVKLKAEENFLEIRAELQKDLSSFHLETKPTEPITLYSKIIPHKKGRKIIQYRATYEIDFTIEEWQFHTVNLDTQRKNPRVDFIKLIDKFDYDDGTTIYLVQLKTKSVPMILSARDSIFFRCVNKVDGNHLYEYSKSIKLDDYPKDPTGKIVRVNVIGSTIRYTPIDGELRKCSKYRCDHFDMTDPKVSVSPMIIKPFIMGEMKTFVKKAKEDTYKLKKAGN